MSIPVSIDPLGTLGAHGFPLPPTLTDGLLDAYVRNYARTYNNCAVTDYKLDYETAAPVLLRMATAIVRLSATETINRVYVADANSQELIQIYTIGQNYTGLYLYDGVPNKRRTVGIRTNKGDVVAVNHLRDPNQQAHVVHNGTIRETVNDGVGQLIENRVEFLNVEQVFFYDYVMSDEEMKEKIAIVENLVL